MKTYRATYADRTVTVEAESSAEAAVARLYDSTLPDHVHYAIVDVDGVAVEVTRDGEWGWTVPGGDPGHAARAADALAARAAAALGRLGGKARSSAKTAAARANGARGGRPGDAPSLPVWVWPAAAGAQPVATGRRSATEEGARLAAKRAGHRVVPGPVHRTVRDGADAWLVSVAAD